MAAEVIELALGSLSLWPSSGSPELLDDELTTERALPSSAVQLRCWTRPTTTTHIARELNRLIEGR